MCSPRQALQSEGAALGGSGGGWVLPLESAWGLIQGCARGLSSGNIKPDHKKGAFVQIIFFFFSFRGSPQAVKQFTDVQARLSTQCNRCGDYADGLDVLVVNHISCSTESIKKQPEKLSPPAMNQTFCTFKGGGAQAACPDSGACLSRGEAVFPRGGACS